MSDPIIEASERGWIADHRKLYLVSEAHLDVPITEAFGSPREVSSGP